MNKGRFIFAGLLLASVALLLGGCEDSGWAVISPLYGLISSASFGSSGPSGPAPVGADIGGHWTGMYVNEEDNDVISIEADIIQLADAITIETSKTNVAHLFHGTIYSNAHVYVTDAFDGQEWTSRDPATSKSLLIRDYTHTPEVDDPEPPLQYISLTR